MAKTIETAGSAVPRGNPLASLLDGVLRGGNTFGSWHQRATERAQLAKLDDRLLADVGIDRETAHRESRKPFWRR